MRTIHCKVTAEDIEHGVKGDCDLCPIKRAIQREVPYWDVSVNLFAAEFGDKVHVSPLPDSAINFIRRFDNKGKDSVQPFEFDLEVADEVLQIPTITSPDENKAA